MKVKNAFADIASNCHQIIEFTCVGNLRSEFFRYNYY